MKWLFLFFTIGTVDASTSLNFMEAHSLRLSSKENAEEWISPLKKRAYSHNFEFNAFILGKKADKDLYSDIQSKETQKLQDRLSNSFGSPYDAAAKINLFWKGSWFNQGISANAGAVGLVDDPVFPNLNFFAYEDVLGHTSKNFKVTDQWNIWSQVSYGKRKILKKQFTVGDMVNRQLKIRFKEEPWRFVSEFNLSSAYTLGSFQLLAEMNSLPLTQNQYSFWDTFLGVGTVNLASWLDNNVDYWRLYAGYAPFYGGHYDVKRSSRLGMQTYFNRFFGLNIFTLDQLLPGAELNFLWKYLNFSLYTLERAYDEGVKFKSRLYGANFSLTF